MMPSPKNTNVIQWPNKCIGGESTCVGKVSVHLSAAGYVNGIFNVMVYDRIVFS